MDDLGGIFIAILVAGVVFFFKFLQSEDIKDRIKAEVKAHGGSDVHISWAVGDGDRDTFTYDVSFVNENKRLQAEINCLAQKSNE